MMSGDPASAVRIELAVRTGRNTRIVPAVATLLVTYCLLAVISMHLEPRGSDWDHHMFRVQEIAWLWSHGVFWPSVSPFLAESSLLPLYAIYSPLPYLPAVLLHLAGVPPLLSSLVIAGVAMSVFVCMLLRWLTDVLGPIRGGLATSAIFFSAYFQANLFARFAYPELLALCMLPWVGRAVWSMTLRCTQRSFAHAAIATTFLFLIHPVTFANCAAFAMLFLVAQAFVRGRAAGAARLGRLPLVLVLAPIVGACFTYPLISNLPDVRGQWNYVVPWSVTEAWLQPGVVDEPVLWFSLALALLLARVQDTLRRSVLIPLAVVAAAAVFLSHEWSTWVWAHLPWPRINLFPWRLIPFYVWPALIIVCARLPARGRWLALAMLIIAYQAVLQVDATWTAFATRDETKRDLARVFDKYAARRTGWGVDEFLPRESQAKRLPSGEAPSLRYIAKQVRAASVNYDCGPAGCAAGAVTLPPYYRDRLHVAIDGVAVKPIALNADSKPVIVLPSNARRISVEVASDPWHTPSELWSVFAFTVLFALLFHARARRPASRLRKA